MEKSPAYALKMENPVFFLLMIKATWNVGGRSSRRSLRRYVIYMGFRCSQHLTSAMTDDSGLIPPLCKRIQRPYQPLPFTKNVLLLVPPMAPSLYGGIPHLKMTRMVYPRRHFLYRFLIFFRRIYRDSTHRHERQISVGYCHQSSSWLW